MKKCEVNSEEIKDKVVDVILDSVEGTQPLLDLKKNIQALLKDLADQYVVENNGEIASIVSDTAQEYGVGEWDSDFFNVNNLNNLLVESRNNIQKVDMGNDVRQLNNTPQARQRTDAGREFLTNAFGLAHEVSGAFQTRAKQNLFDCLFVNRGSLTTQALGSVNNTTELNNNIRVFQTQLLKNITDYLNEIRSRSAKLQFDDEVLDVLDNPVMYDMKNNYTQALEKLREAVNAYIKEPLNGNTDALRQIYNEFRSNTGLVSDRKRAGMLLKAFDAITLLENFDTYLRLVFPSITIKDFNKKTGEDKYQIAGKTAKLMNTWRTSENIVIDKEVSDIVRMAVETSPLYNYGSSTPRDGYFLTFQHFQHIVGKINDLPFDSNLSNIEFNLNFSLAYKDLYDILPEEVKGRTFGYLLGITRKNPQKYLPTLFHLLTSSRLKSYLSDSFTDDECDKLYSINKGLFNGDRSIRQLSSGREDFNIYGAVAQMANSISNVKYLQYFKDYDGKTIVRELFSQAVGNIRRNIQNNINNRNNVQYINDWDGYKKELNLQMRDDTSQNSHIVNIKYTIPNTTINIQVNAASGTVTIPPRAFLRESALKEVLPFIDRILGLNLQNNIDLYNQLLKDPNNVNNVKSLSEDLIKFVSRIILNQCVSRDILFNEKTLIKKKAAVDSIYGRWAPDYNYALGELSLISEGDVHMLYTLALAQANVDGITTSVQVRNGLGNSYSNQTFSRLLGTFASQFELQEKGEDSASRDLQLLTNSNMLKGVYTALEIQEEGGDNKPATDLGVSEMAYTQLVFDFVRGIISDKKDKYAVTGEGEILILPSVNSDKSTIGRLKINVNNEWTLGNIKKPLKDFSNTELRQLIAQEFGNFYEHSFLNVQKDWQTVESIIIRKYPEFAGKLAGDMVHNFKNFNKMCAERNLVPINLVKEAVMEFNSQNRLHPLELIDQVHYIKNGSDLSFNQTFIAQIARFNPDSIIFNNAKRVLNSYPTEKMFWFQKKVEVLESLLKSNFRINTSGASQPELLYLRKTYKNRSNDKTRNWINDSGDLILAKAVKGNTVIDITRQYDYDSMPVGSELILNPLLEQYNYIQYLVSQEWMDLTVGSFIAHPEKTKSSNVIVQEAGRFNAQHKRNNAFTAAVYEFMLGSLNGIPTDYNVAVIEDIHDYQGTISGILNDIKAFDGSTFVHPAVVHLENNSLGGQKAGVTKKQYVHFKNERTGTGGSIKTAGFGITNDWIRNSPFLQNMMIQMSDHVWMNEDGTVFNTDITKDWNGNKIAYKDFFFKEGGKLYKIKSIEAVFGEPNTYVRTIQEVTQDGNPIPDTTVSEKVGGINTNYRLWNLFGGKDSMELDNHRLRPSETSVENLVIAMNNIGVKKSDNIKTQDDIWQALKMADIHYICTAGAVKSGAANINSSAKYNTTEPLDFQRIHMYQAGIQLDKEHQADESDIAMMTQVVSACAAKGYSFETAMGLYNSIRKVTDTNTAPFLKAVQENFEMSDKEKQDFQEFMMKTLVKALASSNSDNFAKNVANSLMSRARSGEKIKFSEANIPLSDNTIYRKVFSTISVMLNKLGIKQHIPGTLSVLTPSYNIMKLYAGRKYESFTNPDEELEQLQQEQAPVFDINDPTTNISNLELGRSYIKTYNSGTETTDENGETIIIPTTEIVSINTPKEYQKLKDEIKAGLVTKVVEYLKDGRNLAGFNVRFNNEYQIWDLNSAQALFELNDIKDAWKSTPENIVALTNFVQHTFGRDIEVTPANGKDVIKVMGILLHRQLQKDLNNLSQSVPNCLDQYQEFLNTREDTPEWYKRYVCWVNLTLGRTDGTKLRDEENNIIPVNSETFDNVNDIVQRMLLRNSQVLVNGRLISVDKSTVRTSAYEIIMAKTFATKYGLDKFADLNVIQNDPDYFIKQYIRNQATKVNPNQYTLEFKRSDGNHVYVLEKKGLVGSGLRKLAGILTCNDESGKTYRLDSNNDIMYEITPDTEIYEDNLGNQVIVSDDIEHYINVLDYDSIKLSDSLAERSATVSEICHLLRESPNEVANEFENYITASGNDIQLVMQNNQEYHDITVDNYQQKLSHPIIKEGHAKHTSFLRSLDVIASRTPSQSMQSFMPMKVVAFENADVNTVYVSTYQLLLQGSDYDIDTASVATFDIDSNGMLQLWSPYANLENNDMREASETLPIPTGQEIEIQETDNMEDALALFVKYRDLLNIRATRVWDKKTKDYDISTTDVSISLNLQTPEQLRKFGNMLREIRAIYKPSNGYIPFFTGYINNNNFTIQGKEQFDNLFIRLKSIIDRHNMYLDRMTNTDKLTRILNNQSMYSMIKIISDPANLMQAQAPLDVVTQPLKDESDKALDGEQAKFRTPGNFVNMFQSIDDNQVGKKDVGKCATGLKIFFGLTEYNNYILNYGTKEQQERLLLGHNHAGKTIGGKTYMTLANIRAVDPQTIQDMNLLEALAQTPNDTDEALSLSAALSLAVDNAKELRLAKLNASTETMSLYLYGIMIGMEFPDIAKIMMSPTGLILTKVLKGNIFLDKRSSYRATSGLNYFESYPISEAARFNITKDSKQNTIPSPWKVFEDNFAKSIDTKDYWNKTDGIYKAINKFATSGLTLETKLEILDNFKDKYKVTGEAKELYNQLLDSLKAYVLDMDSVDKSTLEDLKTLAEGAEEIGKLGRMYSFNQGVKTKPNEAIQQINLIERAIYDITGKTEDIIDIVQFLFNPEYQENAINRYEEVKHTFNILEAIVTNPQFKGYANVLGIVLKCAEQSFKFRSSKALTKVLADYLKYNDEQKIMSGIENFVNDYLRKRWLINREEMITIPKGVLVTDSNNESHFLTQDTSMYLGTDVGEAAFRVFVESKVIPDLQAGRITPDTELGTIKNNLFIRDLAFDLNTKTISGNPKRLYTLPTNMMPNDTSIVDKYRIEFNKIAGYMYEYDVSRFDDEGNEHVDRAKISLLDLFTYYTMIAHNWKKSESSLLPILDDFQNIGLADDFHKFQKAVDESGETLSQENIDLNKIVPYTAPRGNIRNSYYNYMWSRNRETKRNELMRRRSRMEMEQDNDNQYASHSKYVAVGSADTNLFHTGQISDSSNIVQLSLMKGDESIENTIIFDEITGEIQDAGVLLEQYLPDDKKVPFVKRNGLKVVDAERLQQIINDKMNPC